MSRSFDSSFLLILAALLSVVACGCSSEGKAKRALEHYVAVFQSCRDTTEALKKNAGEHRCAAIASAAVDLGLEQTGLEEPRRSEMLNAWLKEKKFVGYYIPKDKRPVEE